MQRTSEITSDTLHLGCGRDYRPDAHNVDAVASVGPDEVVDLEETPWPWPDSSFERIDAEHIFEHLEDIEAVLRECARVLEPGGELRVVMPMGANSVADPDHDHIWTWQTPEFYTGSRHWDVDVGLDVVEKSVETHTHLSGPLGALDRLKWQVQKRRQGYGEWCFSWPSMSGEFTVVFQA